MSKVFVMVVDEVKRKIFAGRLHYKQLPFLGRGELCSKLMKFDLDEGYLLIDKDKKVVINSQNARDFSIKDFEVFNFF
jgi:hypothetical protein